MLLGGPSGVPWVRPEPPAPLLVSFCLVDLLAFCLALTELVAALPVAKFWLAYQVSVWFLTWLLLAARFWQARQLSSG